MVVPPVALIFAVIASQSKVPSEFGLLMRPSSMQRHNFRLVSKIELTDVDELEELDELSVIGTTLCLLSNEAGELATNRCTSW
jgi:hypothetical protein